ncbi:hypothetical protein [Flammeovirga sp. SJP92]|uniref:hypothetical protein n=1 Tax=Flammeovirga sp. SJP92 TaxID=1775430 RepID=UPI0007983220|nr:hypothetical protein [Flammeovirga sp. SJP92]KXX69227.1 hypothetical protein AVL50_16320 [Flammeovirga sp. SJP92]
MEVYFFNGERIEDTKNWNSDWLVIGFYNEDAIFVDTSKKNCPVYGSIQKNNFLLSDSFFEYLSLLNKIMEIELEIPDQCGFDEESCEPIEEIVLKIIDLKPQQGFLEFFLYN